LGGEDAAAAGVVDMAVEGDEAVLAMAVKRAEAMAAYRGPIIRQIRTTLYDELLQTIDQDADRQDRFIR
jgi:enoyl-CoA hydratase/carnithine racemase